MTTRLYQRALLAPLVLTLVASPVAAQEARFDLTKATAEAVKATLEAEAQRPAARGENPYMLPGLILVGGGAALSVIGFTVQTGVKCTEDVSSFECGTTANKGLVFSGVAIAGVGAALIVIGQGKSGMPTLAPRPRGFEIRQRISC